MPSKAYEALRKARHLCAIAGADGALFLDDYGNEFSAQELRKQRGYFAAQPRVEMMDFIALTKSEAEALDFWPHSSQPGLYVLPLWAWWVIPPFGNFEAVSGLQHRYNIASGKYPSKDTRGGYLGFGVRFHIDGSMDIGA